MSQITEPRETGGPAFPCDVFDGKKHTTAAGMTLRDYFAAKAMQALINPKGQDFDRLTEVPEYAYQIADAMLEARKA